jgi:hypothetical protein
MIKIVYYWFQILKNKLKGKKSLVYNLHYDYFFDIFSPIYEELKGERNLAIYFAYRTQTKELYKYLSLDTGIPSKNLISNKISPFIPFDLFICAEITGPDFPINLFKTKKIQIYHGIGIHTLYDKKSVLRRFQIHFAIGINHNKFIIQELSSEKTKYKIYNIGYPKTDRILQNPKENLKNQYTHKNRRTVLYAPHWHQYSSLHKFEEKIIEFLSKLPITLLVKPHNYLYTKYAKENWKKRLQFVCNKYSNVKFIREADTQIVYPLSDMMITDPGTTASFEFSLLQRPIVIFDDVRWFTNKNDINIEKEVYEISFRFKTLEDLKAILDNFLKKDDRFLQLVRKQKQEQENIVNTFLYNPGNATLKAVAAIEKELSKC